MNGVPVTQPMTHAKIVMMFIGSVDAANACGLVIEHGDEGFLVFTKEIAEDSTLALSARRPMLKTQFIDDVEMFVSGFKRGMNYAEKKYIKNAVTGSDA